MDKEYSRTISRQAIPQLLKEINILREPLRAEQRFRLMATGPVRVKTSENCDEEPLEQQLERTLHVDLRENGGFGPQNP